MKTEVNGEVYISPDYLSFVIDEDVWSMNEMLLELNLRLAHWPAFREQVEKNMPHDLALLKLNTPQDQAVPLIFALNQPQLSECKWNVSYNVSESGCSLKILGIK
jgi:hypothetical protein